MAIEPDPDFDLWVMCWWRHFELVFIHWNHDDDTPIWLFVDNAIWEQNITRHFFYA